jgi:tetratricopeptide (TPR) repeat protein
MIKSIRLFCGTLSLFFLLSCIPQIIPQEALLDTPQRHYENGMKLLQAGKVDASYDEFTRALELDREYAPGYVGLGLVASLKGNYKDALEKMAHRWFIYSKQKRGCIWFMSVSCEFT